MKQLLVQNAEINVPMLSFLNHGLKGKFIILMNHSDRTWVPACYFETTLIFFICNQESLVTLINVSNWWMLQSSAEVIWVSQWWSPLW